MEPAIRPGSDTCSLTELYCCQLIAPKGDELPHKISLRNLLTYKYTAVWDWSQVPGRFISGWPTGERPAVNFISGTPDIVLLCRFVGGRRPDVTGQTGLVLDHTTEDGLPEITSTTVHMTAEITTAALTPGTLCRIVTAANSLASFKSRPKTHLFNQTFRPTRSCPQLCVLPPNLTNIILAAGSSWWLHWFERWTRDRKVAGSTPGRGAIKSTRSTQPSIPPG